MNNMKKKWMFIVVATITLSVIFTGCTYPNYKSPDDPRHQNLKKSDSQSNNGVGNHYK